MVATNDTALWRRVWSLKDHGKSWDAVYGRTHPPGFRWLHDSIGSNFRGTEIQAAIGRIQYRRLNDWRAERTGNARIMTDLLSGIAGLRIPTPGPSLTHAYYRLYGYVDVTALADGWTRDRVLLGANARQPLPIVSGSCSEIYREAAFRGTESIPPAPLPHAHAMSASSVAFHVHPGLTPDDLAAAAGALAAALDEAMSTEYRS